MVCDLINLTGFTFSLETDTAVSRTTVTTQDEYYPMARHEHGETECPFCYCAPCITDEKNKQFWWPIDNDAPHSGNTSKRKKLYQRFWGMLCNCGAWHDTRYLTKKAERRGDFTWHKREIMPECVINKCREWYPNPQQTNYMGHKWE